VQIIHKVTFINQTHKSVCSNVSMT